MRDVLIFSELINNSRTRPSFFQEIKYFSNAFYSFALFLPRCGIFRIFSPILMPISIRSHTTCLSFSYPTLLTLFIVFFLLLFLFFFSFTSLFLNLFSGLFYLACQLNYFIYMNFFGPALLFQAPLFLWIRQIHSTRFISENLLPSSSFQYWESVASSE